MPSQRQNIMVAEWAPDMPDLANATAVAQNVVPITTQSYGPFKAFVDFTTNALNTRCLGAIGTQAPDLSGQIFAGTRTQLYILQPPATAWTPVTGIAYSTASGDTWKFEDYNNLLIATNFSDPIQSYEIGVSPNFDPLFTAPNWVPGVAYSTLGQYVLANGNRYVLVGTGTSAGSGTGPSGTGVGIVDGTALWNYQSSPPPRARCMCTPKNFLMVGNTYDPVGGLGPQRIWWSVSGDPTSWPAPGSEAAIQGMSDFNDFQGDYGQVIALVDSLANADVAIIFANAIWRGNFVGPPDVFDFFPVENAKGSSAPNSVVPVGLEIFYLGQDGFYKFDGAVSTPIGVDKFDKWFWGKVDKRLLWAVVGGASIPDKIVMWAFPSLLAINGACDTILFYRWDIDRASYATFGDLSGGQIEWILRALESPTKSLTQTAIIDESHTLGFFNGQPLAAEVQLQTAQLSPGRRSFVQSARPLVDLVSGSITIGVAGQTSLSDPEVFDAFTAPDVSGECPQRNDNRYHTPSIKIAAAGNWTHIIGADVMFTQAGQR